MADDEQQSIDLNRDMTDKDMEDLKKTIAENEKKTKGENKSM